MTDKRTEMIRELLQLFIDEGFSILGALDVEGYRPPDPLYNDGYGDQQDKRPDILAFDPPRNRYIIGVVRTGDRDIETPHALTQYDVFFDHRDETSGVPSFIYFILPPSLVEEFTAFITHYIHRDYWGNMAIVRSQLA